MNGSPSTEHAVQCGALDSPSSRRDFLRTLVASSLTIGPTRARRDTSSSPKNLQLAPGAGEIPSLDELAGDSTEANCDRTWL